MQPLEAYFLTDKTGKRHYGLYCNQSLSKKEADVLSALLQTTGPYKTDLKGDFIGPKEGMESPWSTTVKEILHTVGISAVQRIECFRSYEKRAKERFDSMLERHYEGVGAHIFIKSSQIGAKIVSIADIAAYNVSEQLALDEDELKLLQKHAHTLGRPLWDAEIFGWAQMHSEHCRHKTFSARFFDQKVPLTRSLFDWIKATTAANTNLVVSAYTDNVAFFSGPKVLVFAPTSATCASAFRHTLCKSVLSLKAETHNFPTTVEPFYGAGTGTGGELRDRMAGGQGSLPLAGTTVYMTPYARLGKHKSWENAIPQRPWLYQNPQQLLIKASNGASDYANKFGQPLVCGSVLTFECPDERGTLFAYDKVVMLAGGIGLAHASHAHKLPPRPGDLLLMLGGSNYRIGMGGSTVSSTTTGQQSSKIEQQAIQRANPEMQKRVYDLIRALLSSKNPIRSIHDHGAGGHLNCFVELLDGFGGDIYLDALPTSDDSLSYKELLCNESQERMGVLISAKDLAYVEEVAARVCCPLYVIGKVTKSKRIRCLDRRNNAVAVDLSCDQLLGQTPDRKVALTSMPEVKNRPLSLQSLQKSKVYDYCEQVLQLEGVACKDWLTNKVDRCVSGRVVMQPCCGPLQLPLNNLGVIQLDFEGIRGMGTALGHAPGAALLSAGTGSRLALAEALTNLLWAPLTHGLKGVSCSANWMWPQGKNEKKRLYEAVSALSDYAVALGINIPTGKDSLSMQQSYPSGKVVQSPGTLIISAAAEVQDVRNLITPVLCTEENERNELLYVPFGKDHHLGGSAFAQTLAQLGDQAPEPLAPKDFERAFMSIQSLITAQKVLAGHDVGGGGGLLVTLLELCFSRSDVGMRVDLSEIEGTSLLELLFSESPAVVLQVRDAEESRKQLERDGVRYFCVGNVISEPQLELHYGTQRLSFDVAHYRKAWFATSAALDACQRPPLLAKERSERLGKQPLAYCFPKSFVGKWPPAPKVRKRATILREKGSNSEQEVAYAAHKAGFEVTDMHMTDLMTGRSTLERTDFLVFAGGFAHADVLGAARGWAATFQYNEHARNALDHFYRRQDVLSLGICNGCQLMAELKLLGTVGDQHPRLLPNASEKFECAFVSLEVLESPSVLFKCLEKTRLGVWLAHAQGRFAVPVEAQEAWPLVARYAYDAYPANPNGSRLGAASLCSADGRHTVIMPHIERSLRPFHWAYYPSARRKEEVSPWIMPFSAAHAWFGGK